MPRSGLVHTCSRPSFLEAEIGMMQPQGMPGATKSWKRQERVSPGTSRGSTALLIPHVWTSGLQDDDDDDDDNNDVDKNKFLLRLKKKKKGLSFFSR